MLFIDINPTDPTELIVRFSGSDLFDVETPGRVPNGTVTSVRETLGITAEWPDMWAASVIDRIVICDDCERPVHDGDMVEVTDDPPVCSQCRKYYEYIESESDGEPWGIVDARYHPIIEQRRTYGIG